MSALRNVMVPAPLREGGVWLDEAESRHLLTVLRSEVGDQVRVMDGAGFVALATVTTVRKHLAALTVGDPVAVAPARVAALTVAVAAPKGDKLADMVRSLTELGCGTIVVLDCERSEREVDLARLQRIAREALKQCQRGFLPVIRVGVPLAEICTSNFNRLLVADQLGLTPNVGTTPLPTCVVIGPEGGLTVHERVALIAAGAQPIRLAAPILRIETAAIAAAALFAAGWDG